LANDALEIPKSSAFIAPLIATVPLQLLAYHIADLRGTDVDQPRNLAKSVTVE
jgi:glutamine---fructose-6-phosphate transaminase (isomerizing)